MTFRTKLIAVTLLPIILISFAALWLINEQSKRLAVSQGKVVEQLIREAKRSELENYLKLARAAVEPFYRWDDVSRLQAQKQVADVITNMNFGDDGYFFVSRSNGLPLENPLISELDNRTMFSTYGEEIGLLSKGLVETDYRQGELYQYIWNKPSAKLNAEKIGMAVYLENWDWVIGTGLYTDDIAAQIGQVQSRLEENVQQTRWVFAAMAAGAIALTSILLMLMRFSEQRFADARLKELASEIVEAQETERKRVSTELHDGISQLLVSARYSLDLANENAKRNPKVREPVQKSMETIATAISEIRRISMALRPSILDDVGLAAAIKSLGSDFETQTGIKTTVEAPSVPVALSEQEKTTLYRVAQEALANIAKHSDADHAFITFSSGKLGIRLRISDDGVGIPTSARNFKTPGMGLRNIRERLESHGGRFTLGGSEIGKRRGGTVDVFIPIKGKLPVGLKKNIENETPEKRAA